MPFCIYSRFLLGDAACTCCSVPALPFLWSTYLFEIHGSWIDIAKASPLFFFSLGGWHCHNAIEEHGLKCVLLAMALHLQLTWSCSHHYLVSPTSHSPDCIPNRRAKIKWDSMHAVSLFFGHEPSSLQRNCMLAS